MDEQNKGFFDEDDTVKPAAGEESTAPEGQSPTDEEGQVRIPHSPQDPPPQGSGETLAMLSIVFGLASFVCCGLPASIAAIIAALASRRRMKHMCGMSVVGLLLGIASLLLFALVVVLVFIIAGMLEGAMGDLPEAALLFLPFWR